MATMEESDDRLGEPKEEEELDASYEYNASGECIGVRLGGDLHLYVREEDRPTDVAARLRRHPSSTRPELTAPPSHQPGHPVFAARVPPDMRCGESIDTRTNAFLIEEDVCTNTSRHCLVSRLFLLPSSTAPRHNHRLHHPLRFFSACFYNHLSSFFFVISPQHEPERGAAGVETDQLSESRFACFTPPTSS